MQYNDMVVAAHKDMIELLKNKVSVNKIQFKMQEKYGFGKRKVREMLKTIQVGQE